MRKVRKRVAVTAVGLAAGLLLVAMCGSSAEQPMVCRGMCDASAAVALDSHRFIVADDEQNILRVYHRHRSDKPIALVPLHGLLRIDPNGKHPEADIEGAAVLGEQIFWITSHGRSRDGDWRPNRHRLFAFEVCEDAEALGARPFGTAYDRLADDFQKDPRLRELGLAETIQSAQQTVRRLAPKDEGINIEGLAAGLDGRSLLIGFRNPRPRNKALIVPLLNPREMLAAGATPKLGEPILLDLQVNRGGALRALGIRSLEYVPQWKQYLVVAGDHDETGVFALFRWSGQPGHQPQPLGEVTDAIKGLRKFSPEAAFLWPGESKLQLLSDDGGLRVAVQSPEECLPGAFKDGTCEQKALRNPLRRTFKSLVIDLPP